MSDQPAPALQVSTDRLVGTTQGRYRIVRKIGEGGMGAVYAGEHTLIKRQVAIKCLHAQLATNSDVVARFQNEAMAANAIRHPNIVEVTDMGNFDDGSVFMVLELLEGHDLAAVIAAERALPVNRVVHIMEQTCDALSAAHAQGIIHRDLKPENIFLVKRGSDPDFVKLLDFGIAKFKDSLGQQMTRTGTAMGTPYYMAPEQAQSSRSVDHRSDIYSLGVILFNALTGQHPFEAESYPMLVVKILTEPPPALKSLRSDLPDGLVALVARMLEKKPDGRPATCAEVKDALRPFRNMSDVPVLTPSVLPFLATQASGPLESGVRLSDRAPAQVGETRPIGTPENWVPPPGAAPDAPAAATTGPTPALAAPTPSPTVVRKSQKLVIAGIGAAVFGLATIGGVLVLGQGGDDTADDHPSVSTPVDPAGANPAPEPAVESPQPPSEPEPSGTAEPQTVRVQVTVSPADAELFLDGRRVANPLDVDLPQSSEPRRLEAHREGYRTVVQDLVLEFGQRVAIDMRRGRGLDDRRRDPTPEPTGPTASPMEAEATTATEMQAEPTSAPTMEAEATEDETPAMTAEPSPSMMGGFLDLRGLTTMQ